MGTELDLWNWKAQDELMNWMQSSIASVRCESCCGKTDGRDLELGETLFRTKIKRIALVTLSLAR